MNAKTSTLRKTITDRRIWFWLSLLVIALAAVLLLRHATPTGLGINNDGVGYIMGARNILQGEGYSRFSGGDKIVPITNYPPLYSLTLALLGISGLDIIRVSRLLNMLLIGGNLFLFGVFTARITRSRLLGTLAALLLLASELFLQIHTFALSEPLYIFINLIFLIVIFEYVRKPAWYWLAVAGVVSSLAFLTRYVGASLYIIALIAVLFTNRNLIKSIKSYLIYLLFAVPAVAVWIIRNMLRMETVANRQPHFSPLPAQKIQEGTQTILSWLLPDQLLGSWQSSPLFSILLFCLIGILLIILTLVFVLRALRGHPHPDSGQAEPGDPSQNPDPATSAVEWLIVICYSSVYFLVILIPTLMLLDSSPIFEDRIIFPLYFSAVWYLSGLLHRWWKSGSRIIPALLLLLLLGTFSWDTLKAAQTLYTAGGQGYFAYHWRVSSTIAVVKSDFPPDVLIYSNVPNALYILADRSSFTLTSPINPATNQPRENYAEGIENIRRRVLGNEIILVIFGYESVKQSPSYWLYELTEGLPLYGEYFDGAIFGQKPQQ